MPMGVRFGSASSRWRVPTGESRFVVASTFPGKADLTAARRAKRTPEEMPKGGLVVVALASGAIDRVERVKSFQVPLERGPWLAYLKEKERFNAPVRSASEGGPAARVEVGVAAR